MSTTIVRKKGQITLPIKIREECNIKEYDALKVIALKNGSVLVMPLFSDLEAVVKKTSQEASRKGITLENMLAELREIRKKS